MMQGYWVIKEGETFWKNREASRSPLNSRETVVVEVNGFSPLPGLCLSSLGGVSWLETTLFSKSPYTHFLFHVKGN